MTTISVVVPTYNRSETLPRAIDSVLEQTYSDFECIVVDDGSTDDTQSVVENYADERVRYVAHETNRGANVARNTGIEAAEGEYVAFLDSDDEWEPTKLEAQRGRLASGDWVAAYCDFETELDGAVGGFQSVVARFLASHDTEPDRMEGGEELVPEILADNVHPAAGSTLIVETSVAREVGGFDVDLDRFQDPDFVVRICEVGRLAYVDEPLVVRYDTGSPAPDTVMSADRQYLRKHSRAVERARESGFDVHGAHRLLLAKNYLADGQTGTGVRLLTAASLPPRHLPGVCWAAASGVNRRSGRRTLGALALLLVLFVLVARRAS